MLLIAPTHFPWADNENDQLLKTLAPGAKTCYNHPMIQLFSNIATIIIARAGK